MENGTGPPGSSSSGMPVAEVEKTLAIRYSDHLPPIEDDEEDKVLMDWDRDLVIVCAKCPGKKIPWPMLEQHNKWHTRVNLLSRLRKKIREETVQVTPFGQDDEPGCLFQIDYGTLERTDNIAKADDRSLSLLIQCLYEEVPFVTLKYVEGRKFTIGNKFLSRQSQGDFLYLNLNAEDDGDRTKGESILKEENYVNLECRDASVWVSTHHVEEFSPTTIVSVNGVDLARAGTGNSKENIKTGESIFQRKVNFGDILTISIIGDDGEKEQQRICDFIVGPTKSRDTFAIVAPFCVYPKSSVDVDEDEEQEGRHEDALDNPLILQKIIDFLPTNYVQKLRSLSHLWNTEALKVLRHRVIVTIFELRHEEVESADTLLQISDFAYSKLNQLNFPHWKIKLPRNASRVQFRRWYSYTTRQTDTAQRTKVRDKKILDDLVWLLDPEFQTRNVKSLKLFSRVESDTSLSMIEVLLDAVKNTLTTLKLNLNFSHSLEVPSNSSSLHDMRHLTMLTLSLRDREEKPYSPLFKPFIERFVRGIQNIQTLDLMNSSATPSFSTNVLDEIAKIQMENAEKFVNLTKITITNCSDSQFFKSLSFLRNGSLKEIELGGLTPCASPGGHRPPNQLCCALERHADSIEKLKLQFKLQSSEVDIIFPHQMRKLQHLSLFFWVGLFYHDSISPTVRVKFGQGELIDAIADGSINSIDYNRRFPALSKLSVGPEGETRWRSFVPVLSALLKPSFDENGHIIPVPRVQAVDVPFVINGKYHEVLDNLETMFPNALFPSELTTARQGPRWSSDDEDEEDEEDDEDEDIYFDYDSNNGYDVDDDDMVEVEDDEWEDEGTDYDD